jgi:predicted transposase YdaD
MPYITSMTYGRSQTIERMGIEQGRKEGERSLIFRLLARRVGVVPERLTDRIEQLPIAQLEDLAEALLDFTQLNDLVDWLGDDR